MISARCKMQACLSMRRRVDEAATPSGVAPRNAVRGFRVDRIRSLQQWRRYGACLLAASLAIVTS
jgi:hypothetical protein